VTELVIDQRHRGPARSGNGGYTAGLLAAALDGHGAEAAANPGTKPAIEVSLRVPPPLDVPLQVSVDDEVIRLLQAQTVVAEASAVGAIDELIEPVSFAEAGQVSAGFPGHRFHPFPTCFVCGTERPDGLRIFPGPVEPVEGATRVAAPWLVPAEVDVPIVWAALDCTGGWAGDLTERLMVLGRMTATVDSLPRPGEECVVMGLDHGGEGRRTFTSTTIYGADGRVVGRARHIWVSVDPALFN